MNERRAALPLSGLTVKTLRTILYIVLLSPLFSDPAVVNAAGDARLQQRFQTTPIFGNPKTLTKAEFATAEQWPITKVILLKNQRSSLVLYRSDTSTGRTAAFFHWVASEAGWEKDFAFGMREIDDAYWVEGPADPKSLAVHRAPLSAEVLQASEGALTRGYLRQGVETPWLALIYTDGKTFKETEITYPLVEFEEVVDGQGFVAVVGPAVIKPGPGKIKQAN